MCDFSGGQRANSFTFVDFDPDDPNGLRPRALSGQTERVKRRTTTEEERSNIRAVKSKGPCLRCKILRKQVCFAHKCIWQSANASVR